MQKTANYGLNKPENTDFYDVEHFNSNMDAIDTKMKEIEDKSGNSQELENHIGNKENPHEVTKAQVGLSNVPNVSTNNQTPTYTVPSELSALENGEKLSAAMGKLAKAVRSLIVTRGILPAGETSITILDDRIKEDGNVFTFHTSIYGVNPSSVSVSAGSVTLRFPAQSVDMEVGVQING